MGLSTAQKSAVEHLMRSAPDALLMRLNAVLAAARVEEPQFTPVSDIARAETENRRLRDLVLGPLQALADPNLEPPLRPLLTRVAYARLWRALPDLAPETLKGALAASAGLRPFDPLPAEFTTLYQDAALTLAAGPVPGIPEGERSRLIMLLRLATAIRQAGQKVAGWARNLNGEHMAQVRLAYKDATAGVEEGGPLFIEALQHRLDEPCQVLRLISAVMDRPSDRYLASSEMSAFGEALLADTERQVKAVRQFDPQRGREGGTAAAASLQAAHATLREFETWLTLSKDGPWGGRVAALKQGLSQTAEARIREAEPAVAAALPLASFKAMGSIAPRPGPRIDGYPADGLVQRAEGLLSFLEACRATAAVAGFGSLRGKVIESLEKRIDPYVEDLMERLRDEEDAAPELVRAYLEVAADFLGMIRGPDSAQIIRRRAAAA
jgi:hypothetical protein